MPYPAQVTVDEYDPEETESLANGGEPLEAHHGKTTGPAFCQRVRDAEGHVSGHRDGLGCLSGDADHQRGSDTEPTGRHRLSTSGSMQDLPNRLLHRCGENRPDCSLDAPSTPPRKACLELAQILHVGLLGPVTAFHNG